MGLSHFHKRCWKTGHEPYTGTHCKQCASERVVGQAVGSEADERRNFARSKVVPAGLAQPVFQRPAPGLEHATNTLARLAREKLLPRPFAVGDRVTFMCEDLLCRGVVTAVAGDTVDVRCDNEIPGFSWIVDLSPSETRAHSPIGSRDLKHDEATPKLASVGVDSSGHRLFAGDLVFAERFRRSKGINTRSMELVELQGLDEFGKAYGRWRHDGLPVMFLESRKIYLAVRSSEVRRD